MSYYLKPRMKYEWFGVAELYRRRNWNYGSDETTKGYATRQRLRNDFMTKGAGRYLCNVKINRCHAASLKGDEKGRAPGWDEMRA